MRISDWSSDVCSSDLLLALAIPALTKWQMVALSDGALALVVAAAALVPAIGIARGWNAEGRTADTRFAWLTGTAAALAALALGLLAPVWLDRKSTRLNSGH